MAVKSISYFVAANPNVQQKLLLELKGVMPKLTDHAKLQDLENLPYLNAVIREGLRVGHPVTHRLSRIFPEKALQYHDWVVPSGTIVNMTPLLIHENEDIFPDPKVFRPERWLNNGSLNRYLVLFSRGPRSCLGLKLAWAELYLIVGTVFRRFNLDVELVSKERDIDIVSDVVMGAAQFDSPGVIVKIIQNED